MSVAAAKKKASFHAVRPRLATIWKLDPDSGPHEILVDLESRTVRLNPLLPLEEWRALSAVGG
jgi:hypothetical protein